MYIGVTQSRAFRTDNLVASQTFADGKVMTWTHDARHLVTQAHYDGDLVLEQDHDAGVRLTQQSFGNGLTRDIHFGRPDNYRTGDTVSDTGVFDELTFAYGYAPDKNVLSETQSNGILDKLSFAAAYDAGNRVTSYDRADTYFTARENQSWNYDGAGNWDSTVIDGSTQNRTHSDSDQLEVIAGDNLTYDPRGNQLTDNRDNEYTWDLDNRIIESEGSGYSDIEYRYDALGRRIVRKQGTSKEVLLWWNNTEQSEHKHQAGQTTIQNDLQANPSEAALNTVFARALEGDKQDIQYFHKNYLDHVMAVSDDNGTILEHYRYTAFGEPEIYSPTGQPLASSAIANDILWNVRRYESANGLYIYKYRHYDAASGRWPSRDPIGEGGGNNLYALLANDGVNAYDILRLSERVYTTKEEAIQEASREVWTATAKSAQDGVKEYQPDLSEENFVKLFRGGKDAVLSEGLNHTSSYFGYNTTIKTVYGAEYWTFVCCEEEEVWSYDEAKKGRMPKGLELLENFYGYANPTREEWESASERECIFVHSHNMLINDARYNKPVVESVGSSKLSPEDRRLANLFKIEVIAVSDDNWWDGQDKPKAIPISN